jgi:ribose 5-phosphate isomerase A
VLRALVMARVDESVLVELARHALDVVRGGTVIGLGSGRAATAFVRALAGRVREGFQVRAVPASEETGRLASALGIPIATLDEAPLDVVVDGADEVDPRLDLIKGYGGALVRERILAAASRRQVILVDEGKLVERLGSRGRLPVEIVPFALTLCRRRLDAIGLAPVVREVEGRPFVTDNANLILDCRIGAIADPAALHGTLRALPGVVDTGLFLGTADTVYVAGGGEVRELRRR